MNIFNIKEEDVLLRIWITNQIIHTYGNFNKLRRLQLQTTTTTK